MARKIAALRRDYVLDTRKKFNYFSRTFWLGVYLLLGYGVWSYYAVAKYFVSLEVAAFSFFMILFFMFAMWCVFVNFWEEIRWA